MNNLKSNTLDPESCVPNHVGFILDGNRRWAKQKGLTSFEGHKAGYENLKDIARAAFNEGVKFVSAYIFSTENWNRSKKEVNYLLDLTLWIANHEMKQLEKDQIKVVFLGTMDKISDRLQKAIRRAEDRSKDYKRGTLALCFNYGGQQEIVSAVKKIIRSGQKAEDINPQTISDNLDQSEIPALDLVIRTSGEQRLSNFMIWRSAYAELIFCSKFWPDYTADDLRSDLATFSRRQRRFGQ